jgi:tetratricopeptide (TPR) repeat protein
VKPSLSALVVLATAALLLPTTVVAQSPELNEAYRRGMALQQAGRFGEAAAFLETALRLGETEFGPEHRTTATLLNNLALVYKTLGRLPEAEALYERALAVDEKAFGSEHPEVATDLNNLAGLYHARGRHAEAVPLLERALAINEKSLGPGHPRTATSLNNLAELYKVQGRVGEAEPLLRRALAISETSLGPEHPHVATRLNNLAVVYTNQGRYAEAEPLHGRALAIREKSLGPEHPEVGQSLNNLADLYGAQGRFPEAEPLLQRALAVEEKSLGPGHPEVGKTLNNLARLYQSQGRLPEAEPLLKRALAISEESLGPEHPDVGRSLVSLAELYRVQSRLPEAEPLYKRGLAIREKSLGPEHPDVGQSLNNLAELYRTQGRLPEAEPLLKRALAIFEKSLGPEHPRTAASLDNLALVYGARGRYAEAEPLMKRALAIFEKLFGPEHPDVALSLNNLAFLYDTHGRYLEAESPYKRALAIREKSLGPEHPDTAASLNNLAALYQAHGRLPEAEPLLKRALAISEKSLGHEHPQTATNLNNMAVLYAAQGRRREALEPIRRASAIYRGRAERAGGAVAEGALSEHKDVRFVFLWHAEIALANFGKDEGTDAALLAEAFEAGQLAHASAAAAAVARMGARFAAGGDALAGLAREREDGVEEWRRLDKALVEAVGRPPGNRDAAVEARLRERLAAADQRIKSLDARLATEFPEYAELAAAKPMSLAEAQNLLAADEALLAWAPWDDRTFLWVVRKHGAAMHKLDVGARALAAEVAALRGGLDPVGVATLADIPPFDATQAHALYAKLFASAEPLLEGAAHVFVVPGGALSSLPLGVLVTRRPQAPLAGFAGYREAPWLAKRYALTTLPSASSLRALRRFAKEARARKPFIGIGDPLLDGHPGRDRRAALASLFTPRGVADVRAVKALPALPDTADELKALAKALGAGEENLFVRQAATEVRVKNADLSSARVLAFATHGLVAGDLKGLAEPALVLTPPAEATDADDGLLTASEAAQLKLDAEWVILSACNTAAADGAPGADALSGLAKAFFYAGSRALLVSHWPVFSEAAVRLTTGAIAEAEASPDIGRAEALRRSMLALMNDAANPHYAHPMFWAPFVVVGEGRRPPAGG